MKNLKDSIQVAIIFAVVLLCSVVFLKSVKASDFNEKDIRCLTEAICHEASIGDHDFYK